MTGEQIRDALEAASKFLDALDVATRLARGAIAAFAAVAESSTPATMDEKDMWELDDIVERFPVTRRMVLRARRKGLLRGEPPAGSNRILFERQAVEDWVRGRVSRSSLRAVR